MTQERIIPFPVPARSTAEPEPLPRRRREILDSDRPRSRRRARRRRQGTPWLQRNALSVAAVSILVALLGLGFGLVQMIVRPDPAPALLAIGQSEPTVVAGGTVMTAAAIGPSVPIQPDRGINVTSASAGAGARREIQASVKVIEPNYTIASGDTLGQIASRFNTSIERIQALNNLADPRALRIGTKLVIPPAF
jgi:hypothetical protein